MGLQIKWKTSTDITSQVEWDTFQATLVLTKEVSKIQFSIKQYGSNVNPAPGDQIDFYQNSVHLFGGTVTEKETVLGKNGNGILPIIQYTCTDWSFKMNTILVAKTYANMDPHDIVEDIVNNYTDGTYTINNVQKGNFLVPSITFNYEQVTKCIQKLATLIGWDWNVDPSKDVHFFLVENNPAPFAIDDTSGKIEWPSLDIDLDLTNMKNSVYVIGGTRTTLLTATTTPDVYNTDGVTMSWGLVYKYENNLNFVITLDGVPQTVGIYNQVVDPTTVDILWNPDARSITFTAGAPGPGEVIKVFGDAEIPIVAHLEDPVGISTYGEIQDVITDTQITTVAEAFARAQADIDQYGHAVYTVKFNTLTSGLNIGQIINLNSVILGYTNVPLTIRRLTGNGFGPSDIEWQVEAYGSDQVSFVDIMSGLLQQEAQNNPVSDTTVLQELLDVEESLTLTDALSVASASGPYFWDPSSSPNMIWDFFTWV